MDCPAGKECTTYDSANSCASGYFSELGQMSCTQCENGKQSCVESANG